MRYGKVVIGVACGLLAVAAFAGGNPRYVQFPEGYAGAFTNYATFNRSGSAAVAKMYANDLALSSYKKGQPAASGFRSTVVTRQLGRNAAPAASASGM